MLRSRLACPVVAAGVVWTVAGLIVIQTLTELVIIPVTYGSTLPRPVQLVVVLVVGTTIRATLGVFVASRAVRADVDHVDAVVRTTIVGVLTGLALVWIASWVVVRPHWDLGEWAAELGRVVAGGVLWVLPCAWSARWFIRSDITSTLR
jgi:hypothetical protein